MSDWLHGVRVPPLTIIQLRDLAKMIRVASQLTPEEPFPVLFFFEHSLPMAIPNFDFTIVESLSDGDEARAYPDGCQEYPDGPFVKLTTLVYDGAWAKKGRHRLTVLHECSHIILHRKIAVHRRGPIGAELKPYENSEWQANQLAAELLMPIESIVPSNSLNDYCNTMGVSREAAQLRARKLVERREIQSIAWHSEEEVKMQMHN
jgi:Zn-dependent peptidase ImmA (M78 family)